MLHRWLFTSLLALALTARAAVNYLPGTGAPPAVSREFRGAWIATVNNIDWPSKPGLSSAQQQRELLAILDRARDLKLNALVFQVRPACDALYESTIEPWSEYLTGQMGRAPKPFWDPLAFVVRETHARGIELHAWFNPFRARHSTAFSTVSANHISKTRPSLAKTYGSHMWLDPGSPEAHDYSMRVILDVVKRYDLDGVHIDDYFYPYQERNAAKQVIPFPDWTSWNRYVKAGGKLTRDDWRRDNVNRFVARMYREVKAAKPWLKVGISPFGIYRPGYPAQIKGFDQYESLYADPRHWLMNGWLDYIAPQLYWRIEPPAQSFPVLLDWWTENNPRRKHVIPGMSTSSIGRGTNPWPASEILRQIEIARRQSGAHGHIHWSLSALMNNKGGITTELQASHYRNSALTPALPSGQSAPPAPSVAASDNGSGVRLSWTATQSETGVRFWLVQAKRGDSWQEEIHPAEAARREYKDAPSAFSVRALDRFGQASEPSLLVRQ